MPFIFLSFHHQYMFTIIMVDGATSKFQIPIRRRLIQTSSCFLRYRFQQSRFTVSQQSRFHLRSRSSPGSRSRSSLQVEFAKENEGPILAVAGVQTYDLPHPSQCTAHTNPQDHGALERIKGYFVLSQTIFLNYKLLLKILHKTRNKICCHRHHSMPEKMLSV